MKFTKYIPVVAFLAVSVSGCVDLNYTEVTTNDEEWIYQSPVYGIQQLVTSVYAHLPNGFDKNYEGGSGATLAAATDEADCPISSSTVHFSTMVDGVLKIRFLLRGKIRTRLLQRPIISWKTR